MTDFVSWTEFTRRRWGKRWALCRNTIINRLRHGRCISRKEYFAAYVDHFSKHGQMDCGGTTP